MLIRIRSPLSNSMKKGCPWNCLIFGNSSCSVWPSPGSFWSAKRSDTGGLRRSGHNCTFLDKNAPPVPHPTTDSRIAHQLSLSPCYIQSPSHSFSNPSTTKQSKNEYRSIPTALYRRSFFAVVTTFTTTSGVLWPTGASRITYYYYIKMLQNEYMNPIDMEKDEFIKA